MNDDYARRTDEVIAFMQARLDELDKLARQTQPGPWTTHREDDGQWSLYGAQRSGLVAVVPQAHTAEHIAGLHRDAVLASVAADRALITAYEQACNVAQPDPADNGYLDGVAHAIRCRAAAWRSHPDYREDWRP